MAINIPINIARALLPNRKDYVMLSHIYTPLRPDFETDSTITYKIPYAANVHWTHICPIWTGEHQPHYTLLYEDTGLRTSIAVPMEADIISGYYQPFEWPIPAVHFKPGAYLCIRINKPLLSKTMDTLRINILGFEGILPDSAPEYIYENTHDPSSIWSIRCDTSTYTIIPPIARSKYPIHKEAVIVSHSSDLILRGIL